MTNEEIINRLSELMPNNPGISDMADTINQILEFDEEALTPTMMDTLTQTIKVMFDSAVTQEMTNTIKRSFHDQGLTRADVVQYLGHFENDVQSFINELDTTINKRKILHTMFEPLIETFNAISEQYHSYNIKLPMMLEEGAQEPTYAHDTDACADLYAADTITLPAHSLSNMIRTGVHIQLPEGWLAMIFPRSSIGAKTGLRLSNSVGIIDQGYLGQLGVLYDNTSNSDYTINKGDRIAQLMIMPSYRFKAQIVDHLKETDRGEGGFGSSGK